MKINRKIFYYGVNTKFQFTKIKNFKLSIKLEGKQKGIFIKKYKIVVNLVEKYNREKLENVMKRRLFVIPSFEIYNGVAGLYDYGPTGCALKNNIESYFREHFILEENMLEICATNLTPEIVLKTSGHVERFTDYCVKDSKTGTCYRADKLIQEYIEKTINKKKNIKDSELHELQKLHSEVDKMDEKELDDVIIKYKIKAPQTNNDLSSSYKFNLMFDTPIGPQGAIKGYLRPETAQGHFVNFKKLLEFNGGKIPFASASIGLGFRNEISPRSGLLRVREFTMAEIEHYVDPLNKHHKKFKLVKNLKLPLWTAKNQKEGKGIINDLTLDEAVYQKTIDNETLAYFLARTYIFLTRIGISISGIRFRQHTEKEMAHYASDCWDAEIETSYGWIEVAGHADRKCYDLSAHSKVSGVELCASRILPKPFLKKVVKVILNKGLIYKDFKDKNKEIIPYLESLDENNKEKLALEYEKNNKTINILIDEKQIILNENHLKFEEIEIKVTEEKFIPGVIEPSFGIGRIVYCVLEHCFGIREKDEKRTLFKFPPVVAPYKVSILPLIHTEEMLKFVEPLRKILVTNSISYKIDDISDSIGRRYARTDEIGIPFAITIDDLTPIDQTITLREINTMKQIRVPINEVGNVLRDIVNLNDSWDNVQNIFPSFEAPIKEKIQI